MRTVCPLCACESLEEFLRRDGVPVFQNFPYASAKEARAAPRGDLRLACCTNCSFITNVAFSNDLLSYQEGYENDQTFSGLFEDYVASLTSSIVDEHGVRGQRVVEVGCGRGGFLRAVCARGDNQGRGFDPSYTGPDSVDGGRVRFSRAYYGRQFPNEHADVVLCRHVIEHVPEPLELLGAIRDALRKSVTAKLFFETPDVGWILEQTVVQDFFYEHCSYFTAASLRSAFHAAGFSSVEVSRIFGGQYLWLTASAHRGWTNEAHSDASDVAGTLALARRFAVDEGRRAGRLRDGVSALLPRGKVALWGAGAKGVTFLNQIDPTAENIECVVDINPRKQARFVSGTAHAIVSPSELRSRGVTSVIVMNPNYADEIRRNIAEMGSDVLVLTEGEM